MREADDAPAGNVIEFDVIADLRRALEKGIGGGNGNGGNGGGDNGDDPLIGRPSDGRVLLNALVSQMAEFHQQRHPALNG